MLRRIKKFFSDDGAAVAVEAALLMPVLASILCGSIDIGIGLVTSQKVINATQTVSDLLTRTSSVTTNDINDAIIAGQLSLMPYDLTTFGVDIAGVKFIGVTKVPTSTRLRIDASNQ